MITSRPQLPGSDADVWPPFAGDHMVYRIFDRQTGLAIGSYSRGHHDVFDFESARHARDANCHGEFLQLDKYRIAKYRVTYELVDGDV